MGFRRVRPSRTPGAANLSPGDWIETIATITACRYQFSRLNTLTLGIPATRRFRLTFDYYAHGRLYSGEFQADRAIPQNEHLPIHYNPLHPEQNSLTHTPGDAAANPLIPFGIAGSVVFSLLWFGLLRGCH